MTQKNRIGCGWVVATFGVARAIWRVAGEKKPLFEWLGIGEWRLEEWVVTYSIVWPGMERVAL